MEIKETGTRVSEWYMMLQDAEYYKYIFKKTEKIACAVFYILRTEEEETHADAVKDDLENTARTLLDTALLSLSSTKTSIDTVARQLRVDLVALESHLRIAHAARHLDAEILEVFLREVYALQRTLRQYTERSGVNPLTVPDENPINRERKAARISVPTIQKSVQPQMMGQKSRRDHIIEILRDKGSATIKDITDVITDCSEKTIQRELIALIKDNKVHREGERRWSKYNLI